MNNRRSEKKLALLLVGVGFLLVFFIWKASWNVKTYGEEYSYKALNQASGNRTAILAQPGSILDANGTYLAVTKVIYRLILDPKVMAQTEKNYPGSLEKTCEMTAQVLGLSKEELLEAFTKDETSSYLRFKDNTFISEQQVNAWNTAVEAFDQEKKTYNAKAENKDRKITARIGGVWFEKEYRREYPLDNVLSKVVGYTTPDAQEGITGLEKYYNDVLRGINGAAYTYIDEEGNSVTRVADAENGLTLCTSLDANVARLMQESIAEFSEEIGGHRINALVMDPNTFEIIAMASDTDFDLNNPSDISAFFTEEELEHPEETFLLTEAFKNREYQLEEMTHDELITALTQQVQLNYAVSGTFEPGSTSKGLTLAACIEENVLQKDTVTNCDHVIPVANYLIHCHQEVPCGDLIPIEAYGRSCNVCFVRYGLMLGAERMAKYQELFNLGQKTGVDLPGEANTANLIYREQDLHDIELATNAFGQGYTLTMVQMAAAYCSLINGGYYCEPHIVTAIKDLSGNVVKDIEPVLVRRTISKETSDYMKEAMRYVVTYGTATPSLTEGYPMAGKTGASEKLPRGTGKYVVSFISAAPIEDPRYLLYVTVDEPYAEDQSMSMPAQLLARRIWEKLYDYWNIYPESDEDAYSYDWSRLKDFSGLDDGQDPEGVITEQTEPAPVPSSMIQEETQPAEAPGEDTGGENEAYPTDIPADG